MSVVQDKDEAPIRRCERKGLMARHANGWRLRRSAELRRAALVSRICATTATMLGDADAPPSFDMSRFLTCTDGISQAAPLSGRTCDRDESMTLLRSAPAQSPTWAHSRRSNPPGVRTEPPQVAPPAKCVTVTPEHAAH